jgi:hypothetical protein
MKTTPGDLAGFRVIESPYLTQPGDPVTVRRTWRERLLSLPWRPFVATRVVIPQVPYRGFVRLNAHTIAMHPETLRELRKVTQGEGLRDPG